VSRRDDRGAATVLVVALTGLLVVVGLAVAGVTGVVVAHRRAQSAADLSVLAGARAVSRAVDPCGSARQVAEANDARLESCTVEGRDVLVAVSVTARPGFGLSFDLFARARAGPG
jgi:secretion/DNA translocation related TadE-like protein